MDLLIYVIVSLIGIYLTLIASEYCYQGFRKQTNYRYIIYFVLALTFGAQHYSVLFNEVLIDNWFYFISFNMEKPTNIMRLFSLLFFLLTILTPAAIKIKIFVKA